MTCVLFITNISSVYHASSLLEDFKIDKKKTDIIFAPRAFQQQNQNDIAAVMEEIHFYSRWKLREFYCKQENKL